MASVRRTESIACRTADTCVRRRCILQTKGGTPQHRADHRAQSPKTRRATCARQQRGTNESRTDDSIASSRDTTGRNIQTRAYSRHKYRNTGYASEKYVGNAAAHGHNTRVMARANQAPSLRRRGRGRRDAFRRVSGTRRPDNQLMRCDTVAGTRERRAELGAEGRCQKAEAAALATADQILLMHALNVSDSDGGQKAAFLMLQCRIVRRRFQS
jgi:hypothetical protein